MRRNLYIGSVFIAVLLALGVGSAVLSKRAVVQAAGGTQAPRFEVDPMWPKPLPNHWIMGNVIGVSVGTRMQEGVKEYCWPMARTVTAPSGSIALPRLLSMNSPPRCRVRGSAVSTRLCGIAP